MESKAYSHAKTKLRYHLIFVTKYRKKILNDIREDILKIFLDVTKKYGWDIITQEIDKDHIHILIHFGSKFSIGYVVKIIKMMTTREIYKLHNSYLKKYYWKKNILWSNGYFCATIGDISEQDIKKYIEEQGD